MKSQHFFHRHHVQTCIYIILPAACIMLLIKLMPANTFTQHSYETVPESIQTDAELLKAQNTVKSDSLNTNLYIRIWNYLTDTKSYNLVIQSAQKAYTLGIGNKNQLLKTAAAMYMAQSYMLKEDQQNTDRWLKLSLEALDKLPEKNLFLTGRINNLAGIQSMTTEVDYASALRYFRTALAAVEETGDSLNEGSLLRNISHIYEIREDSSGFDYALRSYNLASGTGDINIRSLAALTLSSMYILKNDSVNARKYADESIEHISDSTYNKANKTYAYYNYGNVCAMTKDREKAEYYYCLALKYIPHTNATIAIRAYTSVGNLYKRQQRYNEAIDMYLRAEALFNSSNVECQLPVFSGISQAYDALGDKMKALEYYKKFFNINTKTLNIQSEQAFSDLLMKYEQQEHRQAMNMKELELVKKDRNIMLAILIISIVSVLFICIGILYWRKNAMFRQLVQQNLNYRERINENRKLKELKKLNKQQSWMKIYEALENLMKNEKLYRRKDITIQMLAEMLGTNTTYMSDLINRFSGKSFPNYINSFRMEEVLETLSDPSNEEPISLIFERAGFMSRTTYTRIFKKEIGCTPSKYREEIQRLHSNQCADSNIFRSSTADKR